jgi:UDP-glucuronate 4-epimerase
LLASVSVRRKLRSRFSLLMKILVTGGAGFIGSHTVERLLADGHEVTIIDNFNDYYDPAIKRENIRAIRDRITVLESDLRDAATSDEAFAKGKFDAVIHLAARAGVRPSIEAPELYIDTNIKGTFHLLEAAKRQEVKKFVFASSSSVYGVNKKIPFAEEDPILQTISPYAMTKMAGEQMCSNYSHLAGIRTVCLRFFTVYGPRQRPDLAIHKFSRLMLAGKPLPFFGDGETRRDYTWVDDIVQGVLAACDVPLTYDTFNLGGARTTSLKELVALLEKELGVPAILDKKPAQQGDMPQTSADVTHAGEVLGYSPGTPIDQGIRKFAAWVRGEGADWL